MVNVICRSKNIIFHSCHSIVSILVCSIPLFYIPSLIYIKFFFSSLFPFFLFLLLFQACFFLFHLYFSFLLFSSSSFLILFSFLTTSHLCCLSFSLSMFSSFFFDNTANLKINSSINLHRFLHQMNFICILHLVCFLHFELGTKILCIYRKT